MKKHGFHYDHINQFIKSTTIYAMVAAGQSFEEIEIELDKCQLLCIECHHIVTAAEHVIGLKAAANAAIKAELKSELKAADTTSTTSKTPENNNDEEKHTELIQRRYLNIYTTVFDDVYAVIRLKRDRRQQSHCLIS